MSAAPGFFVDHENDEGLGNDVYLRGFDLEHGSGIEMGVGNVPVNQPIHIQGQGYTDVNFIIPEVVDSVHVLAGTYDPRQGDAAIVGSAFFNLAMRERGYHAAGSYGSFNQARVLGIVAPRGLSDETFAAFAGRRTDGFGARRGSESGSVNAQLGVDLGAADHLRVLGHRLRRARGLAGVLREDHVEAGRIGYYDSYPFLGREPAGPGRARVGLRRVAAHRVRGPLRSRAVGDADRFSHPAELRGRLRDLPDRSQLGRPRGSVRARERGNAVGVRSSFKSLPLTPARGVRVVTEPGVSFRLGRTDQTRNLLVPDTLRVWDRRTDASVTTLDAGAYLDLDVRLLRAPATRGRPARGRAFGFSRGPTRRPDERRGGRPGTGPRPVQRSAPA